MKWSIIAAMLSMGMVVNANAATLVPMKGVSILYINGQKADSKITENEVDEGMTQVVVRMDKKVSRSSSQKVYTSAPYVITFDVTGNEVKINHPVARSKSEAEAVFRTGNPDWRITQDGKSLAYEQEKLKGKDGFLPYAGMDELVAKHNKTRGLSFGASGLEVAAASTAAVATTAVVASSGNKAKVKKTENKKGAAGQSNGTPVEHLKKWYLNASSAERKEFRKWMIDQE
jgi:uncharacterized protein YccT (UPF0319 family)